MSNFDVKKATNDCVQWIKDFFEKNGKDVWQSLVSQVVRIQALWQHYV